MADFIVTTLDDTVNPGDGVLSLREALALANGNGSAESDTIRFAAGLSGGTVVLTSGQQLSITTDDITIDGDVNGDDVADITISGDADGSGTATALDTRVFNVSGSIATLDALVITGGNAVLGDGGGVFVAGGANLTIANSDVSGNTAGNFGGGMYVNNSTVALINSNVADNSAALYGGGIFNINGGTVSLASTAVTGNSAVDSGGGIWNAGTVSLTYADLSGNSANDSGGGIVNYGTATLTNTTVSGNNPALVGVRGGGIANFGTVTSTDTVVSENFANTGGGIFNSGTLTLTGATLLDNDAGGGGGIQNGGTAILTNTVLSENGALNGGGILNTGMLTLTDSTVSDNNAEEGGGVTNASLASATLTNVTLSSNSAGSLGGGLSNLGSATLTNVTLWGNSAGSFGGGVYTAGSVTVTNSTLSGNSAVQAGGGIYNDGSLTLTNTIVAGNGAPIGSDLRVTGTTAFTGVNLFSQAGVGDAEDISNVPVADVFAALVTLDPDGIPGNGDEFQAGALAGNGGPVETIALGAALTNPALDAGDDGLDAAADARGLARVDVPGLVNNGANISDIGAFELQASAFEAPSLVVTTAADVVDVFDNLTSLREALALANSDPTTDDTITFAPTLLDETLFLTSGELEITTDGITVDGDIDGDGDADIIISGNNASRVLFITDGAATTISAVLNSLVIQDAYATGQAGGGIFVGGFDALTLTNSTVSGNSAGVGAGISGGISSEITLVNSTVSGNSAGRGGGIYSEGTITLINATVFGNHADYGAGIYGRNDAVITLTNSTVSGNGADLAGGGIYSGISGVTTLANSIVAGNEALGLPDDLSTNGASTQSELVFTGGNIIGSSPRGFATVTGAPTAQIDGASQAELETVFADVALVDPDGPGGNSPFLAGVLADNGGSVQTIALRLVGIAHNAGDDGVLPPDTQDLDGDGDIAEPLPVDARGLLRSFGVSTDIGAFEIQLGQVGDLNGDFHTDIVWRENSGIVALWEMNGVDVLSNTGIAAIPNDWQVVDADSDFDGDGMSDILWRENSGVVVLWTMDGPAILSNTAIAATAIGPIPDHWNIEDTGDFTGDGRADILWRENTGRIVLWEMDGATIVNNTRVADVPVTSQIQDTADFTGDGMNDILWRDDDGTIRIWEMDGAILVSDTTVATLPDHWRFADTGDFNGDFRSDILWRDNAGTVVMWEMNGPVVVDNSAVNTIPLHWNIVA
jgi:predicted outer membrane repeat protein